MLALAFALLGFSAAKAQNNRFGFGVKGGLGLADQNITLDDKDKLAGITESELNKSETKYVFNAGVYIEAAIPTTNFAINVGAAYRVKGTKKKFEDASSGEVLKQDVDIHYASVDAVVKYYLLKKPLVGLYIGAGPRADIKLSSSGDLFKDANAGSATPDQAFNAATFSAVAVAGVQLWKLGLEAEWNPDITYSSKTDYGAYKVNTRNYVVGVNLSFRIAGI